MQKAKGIPHIAVRIGSKQKKLRGSHQKTMKNKEKYSRQSGIIKYHKNEKQYVVRKWRRLTIYCGRPR